MDSATQTLPAVADAINADAILAAHLAAARRGDRAAQAALLARLQDVWFRFCFAMLDDADLARDATQETALRFLQRLPTFAGQSSLQTWSLGIALNACREARRKRWSFPRLVGRLRMTRESSAGVRDSGRAGEPPADAGLAMREEQARLRELVRELPRRQREAVVLRYLEEMSVAEVAEAMGCAVGTVKATLAQALENLRRRWETNQ
ncbi:MAG: sigma-70 family RNA polymerase sigma factor [Planctomycetota bacterium]|nr:sigma-70 family RNA polymerase sigma factor [Planctomycetota bacterium]